MTHDITSGHLEASNKTVADIGGNTGEEEIKTQSSREQYIEDHHIKHGPITTRECVKRQLLKVFTSRV